MEDEEDDDDINPTRCEIYNEQKEFFFEVLVMFWDKFVKNDCVLMEAILELLKQLWEKPRYYVFVCAGNFAQVSQH